MYSNDINVNAMDSFNNSNRLFNLSDTQNIWSNSEKTFYSTDPFFSSFRNKSLFNGSNIMTQQIMVDRQTKPRKAATGERRDTNLIVNYLPDGFFEKDLYDLFSKAGPIAHYHVVRNKENRSECYGFVDFEKSIDAEKAIEMFHQYPIQNKKLKVQNAYEGLLIKQEEKEKMDKGISNMGYNIEIRNAPTRWTVNDVKNIFGKYGEILKVYENSPSNMENNENSITPDGPTKIFNVIYRYQTVAAKVIKKKNKQPAEAMFPLGLEMSIVGQEFVDNIVTEQQPPIRCRSRNGGKLKFDQLSDASWESKFGNNPIAQIEGKSVLWNEKFDLLSTKPYDVNYWVDSNNNNATNSISMLSANGRPILKHKDSNMMHLTDNDDLSDVFRDGTNRLMSPPNLDDNQHSLLQLNDCNSFARKIFCDNQLKNIWEMKEKRSILPTDIFKRTSLVGSRFESSKRGKYHANVSFKMEYQQKSGSFKLRGMAYACYKAKWDGVGLVISSSGGNAGLAVAYACRMLKLCCTIVVPTTTHHRILEDLTKEGAEIIQEGNCWAESHVRAELIRDSYPGLCRLIHPFDDPLLWNGYESIVDEIVEDMKDEKIDLIVVAVGGGGLLNGIAQGITKNRLNKNTAILSMETEGTASLNKAMSSKQLVTIAPEGVATSLAASRVSQRSLEIFKNQDHHLFSMTCTDAEAIESCFQFLNEQSVLVEPACGAALASVYNGTLDQMAECRHCDLNVIVVVCGGRCIDIDDLYHIRHLMLNTPPLPISNPITPSNSSRYWQQSQPAISTNENSNYDVAYRLSHLDMTDSNPNNITASSSSASFYSQHSSQQQQHLFQHLHKSTASTPFSYSSIASKNLGPIKDQTNQSKSSNILTDTNCNNNNAKIAFGQSNNNSFEYLSQQHNSESYQSILAASASGNNAINNTNTNMYSPFSPDSTNSTDMVASPVGSQHSDKENRLIMSSDN